MFKFPKEKTRSSKETQSTILMIILIIINLGIIIFWINLWMDFSKTSSLQGKTEEKLVKESVFNLSATVLSVNPENNFLLVKPIKEKKEIKVILNEDTKLFKLKFPSDPKDLSKGRTFSPQKTEIKISDIKKEDHIFIKTNEDILGKVEFSNVDFIEILP